MSSTTPLIDRVEPLALRGEDVCVRAGISYRQLHYWTRCGLIAPSIRPAFGSGSQRLFSVRDSRFVAQLARLVRAGMNVRVAAAALTAQSVDGVLPSRLVLGGGCRRLAA